MKTEYINGQVVRRRRQQMGEHGSIRAFARATGLTGIIVRSIETKNHITGDTPLHQLARMADVLGVPVTDLLNRPRPPQEAEDPTDAYAEAEAEAEAEDLVEDDSELLAEDVGRLARLLTRDSRLTRKVAIAQVFDWELSRLRAAQQALAEHLQPVGMTIYEVNGMVALRPADSSGDVDADRVAAVRVAAEGMTLRQAEILHDIMTGSLLSNQVSEDRLPFLGSLMNLGLAYHEMSGGMNSYRLTPDAAYAFDV